MAFCSRRAASTLLRTAAPALPRRSFQTSARLLETQAAALPQKRPVGAFRATIFGFLTGSVTAGAGMYYYVMDEYKLANQLLQEDIYVRILPAPFSYFPPSYGYNICSIGDWARDEAAGPGIAYLGYFGGGANECRQRALSRRGNRRVYEGCLLTQISPIV
ncbi:hypothetical protein BK809_0002116 [Diplodia seriata]|uniref:Uncharacterized protein n=1 Tax=Diplodia seriata TaxID=420778 RepID=A0A1S8BEH9_9PEZI|nr:hypothetical protein BK809_0002116 [Diplodia seriata]